MGLTCAVVNCRRKAVKAGFCGPCWRWAYVILADPRYRTEVAPYAPVATQASLPSEEAVG